MRPQIHFEVTDSDTGDSFPDHGIAAVSYTASWQLLRQRCHFKTLADARIAVAILDMYIAQSPKEELQYRVWRVGNLFRAVPRANPTVYGIRCMDPAVGHYIPIHADRLLQLTIKVGKPVSWDWAVTRRDVLITWQKAPQEFRMSCHNLKLRTGRSRRPKSELRHYLSICEEIMDEYLPTSLFEGDL
jgi:hypothetical protein